MRCYSTLACSFVSFGATWLGETCRYHEEVFRDQLYNQPTSADFTPPMYLDVESVWPIGTIHPHVWLSELSCIFCIFCRFQTPHCSYQHSHWKIHFIQGMVKCHVLHRKTTPSPRDIGQISSAHHFCCFPRCRLHVSPHSIQAISRFESCESSIESLSSKSNHANIVMARTGDFSFPDFGFGTPQTSFTQSAGLPAPIQSQQPPFFPAASTVASPIAETPTPTSAAHKRKASSAEDDDDNLEDSSRAAAEEDKRRRNTAASARFRVKKKQREQALEKSAKEMSDKVAALEGRINQLETENKWLKNLVTEKTESKEDIATLWKKYNAEKEREPVDGKEGVGTRS